MIRGVQSAMEGMRAQLARQEVVARNLENLATAGFKQESGAVDGFAATLGRLDTRVSRSPLQLAATTSVLGSIGVDTAIDRVSVDFGQGRIEETKRPLDVALAGDGFLQVRAPDGPMFFRGGPLYRDSNGTLVTSEGYQLLGTDGQDLVLKGNEVSIAGNGDITVDDNPSGTLSVVEFAPGTLLSKVGREFYVPDSQNSLPPVGATNTEVKQGFLEASNVDEVSAMTGLVSIVRAYQANQRMLQAEDELVGKAVNEVGRV